MSIPRFLSIAEQVAGFLQDELLRGRWRGTMPGLPCLARELGVDPKTVAIALGQLERQGLLERQGAGRRRRILLAKQSATKDSALKIAILTNGPPAMSDGYLIELLHLLQEAGHHAFFAPKCLTQLKMKVERVNRLVTKTPADAWVVEAASREVLEWFVGRGIPAFALFGRRRDLPIAAAGPDKAPAYREVVRQLVAFGHRQIVLLAMKSRRLPHPGAPERAFLEELAAHGIPTSHYHLPDWEQSAEDLQDLLDSLFRVTPPTALIIDEAYLFHAVKHHLSHQAIQVPEDVSLVCTDPDRTFDWCRPTIAHIAWNSGPVVRRIVRWASNVSGGRKDVRQLSAPAVYVPGGTVGQR